MADDLLDQNSVDPRVINAGLRNESALIVAQRTIGVTMASQRLGLAKQSHHTWLQKHGARAALVCAAHGIKWVPADAPYVDSADLAAIGRLARRGLDKIVPAMPEALLNGGMVDEGDTVPGALGD